ncbi:MAG: hypothetical protein QOJ73_663 [Streptosporangiaceae bacterium]|nr:hypothetical protein [Streptosporangiaceae bacterium]
MCRGSFLATLEGSENPDIRRRRYGMDDRQTMRASDHDRQDVVDLLRGAVGDGRLQMDEYVGRMESAYQAVTYGDLVALHADLPAAARVTPSAITPKAAPATASRYCLLAAFAGLPAVLKVLWTIWLTAVSVNVVVWGLVSATTAHLIYPWPLWVAGPYGAVLFALSVPSAAGRRSRDRAVAASRP